MKGYTNFKNFTIFLVSYRNFLTPGNKSEQQSNPCLCMQKRLQNTKQISKLTKMFLKQRIKFKKNEYKWLSNHLYPSLFNLNSQFDNTLSPSPHTQSHRTLQTPPRSQPYILQTTSHLPDLTPPAVWS